MKIRVIGGGLAGPEAALTAARLGCQWTYMKCAPASTGIPGSLRLTRRSSSENWCAPTRSRASRPTPRPGFLSRKCGAPHSALLRIADQTAVPAGHALAVDRVEFSQKIADAIAAEPTIRVIREEVTRLDDFDGLTIVATGPLTSDALSREIQRLTGSDHLAFYDSISPIVDAESIDMNRVYFAARWDKGTADYINCPMNREEYDRFYDALLAAEPAESKDWENLECLQPSSKKPADGPRYFEGCLPIEVLARRGRDTLRFGPMKPVGLRDPRTGKTPWAVVQLRKENLRADSYNLVGFPESPEVWRTGARPAPDPRA